MTLIFANGEPQRQRGLTLFELLIALAIIALATTMTFNNMRSSAPSIAVKLATEQLLADIKWARLEADALKTPVTISFNGHAYSIAALNVSRSLPRGVEAKIIGSAEPNIIIGPGFSLTKYEVSLSKGNARTSVIIEAVTRKARAQ